MAAISVREEKGKELANQLTGREDIYLHLDPTLLLRAEEWKKIEKKPKLYDGGNYILKYFLGEKDSKINQDIPSIFKRAYYRVMRWGVDILRKILRKGY